MKLWPAVIRSCSNGCRACRIPPRKIYAVYIPGPRRSCSAPRFRFYATNASPVPESPARAETAHSSNLTIHPVQPAVKAEAEVAPTSESLPPLDVTERTQRMMTIETEPTAESSPPVDSFKPTFQPTIKAETAHAPESSPQVDIVESPSQHPATDEPAPVVDSASPADVIESFFQPSTTAQPTAPVSVESASSADAVEPPFRPAVTDETTPTSPIESAPPVEVIESSSPDTSPSSPPPYVESASPVDAVEPTAVTEETSPTPTIGSAPPVEAIESSFTDTSPSLENQESKPDLEQLAEDVMPQPQSAPPASDPDRFMKYKWASVALPSLPTKPGYPAPLINQHELDTYLLPLYGRDWRITNVLPLMHIFGEKTRKRNASAKAMLTRFRFKTEDEAIAFSEQVFKLAEAERHHPTLVYAGKFVVIRLHTHSAFVPDDIPPSSADGPPADSEKAKNAAKKEESSSAGPAPVPQFPEFPPLDPPPPKLNAVSGITAHDLRLALLIHSIPSPKPLTFEKPEPYVARPTEVRYVHLHSSPKELNVRRPPDLALLRNLEGKQVQSAPPGPCPLCGGAHWKAECSKFVKASRRKSVA